MRGAARPTVADVQLRPEQPEDRPAVHALHRAAFGAHGTPVAQLVDALSGPGTPFGRAPSLSLVAQPAADDRAVVGHVMLSSALLDAAPRLVEVRVLSPLAVAPGHQRRGVGAALVAATLRAARDEGCPAVFLEGDPDYYARFGFVPGLSHGFRRPSLRIPGPAFQVFLLPAHEAWMTGTLVYPEAFWRLDAVGLRDALPDTAG